MKKLERINLYKKLCLHPKFDLLPERLQEVLSYLAAGYTDQELSNIYKVSHGTPWSYRDSIFKRYNFKIFEPTTSRTRKMRSMTMEEIKSKLA